MPTYRSASGSSAEDLFIELFSDTFGAEKAGYLYSQYPFSDIYQNSRFADFLIENGGRKVAIEIDDEASHNPKLVSQNKFYDDLLKQNSMIYLGWDVYRWAVRQMQQQPETVKDELRVFLGQHPSFKEIEDYLPTQRGKSLDGSQLELKEHQKQALAGLEEMRCNFETIALLYHATGTGKTVTAVMDAKRFGKRTLFLAHTVELVDQATKTFRELWPRVTVGRYVESMKQGNAFVVCGSIQSVALNLERFKPDDFGYLKKPVKAQVDAIVDELAKLPEVAECYEHWNRLRDELERYYKDAPREHKPLSQQSEFKAIKNMVIREAEELRLGTFTFEDTAMKDEVDEDQEEVYYAWSSHWEMAEAYQNAKEILSVYENTEEEKAEQVRLLEQLWGAGFTVAAHLLGKCWRDGMGVLPDDEQAELWFRRAAEAGHDFSQYALGKLLQRQKRMEEAVSWYEKAAAQGSPYAAYRLGKLYLEGKDIPKDTTEAVKYLTDAAQEGNQYAQYALGKLYLTGQDVSQDREQAYNWFWESASQGNEYAQFFLDHFNDNHSPNVLLSATKLLHHMGRIFQDNSIPPCPPGSQRADRKLRQKIRQKKIAMGHKPDDHEEEQNMGGMTMGGM